MGCFGPADGQWTQRIPDAARSVGYPNEASGDNISEGFEADDETPIAIANYDQPANEGNLRGTFWRVNLDGVDGAAGPVDPNPSAVPVPGAVWLFGSALLGFVGFGRKKSI